MFMAAAFSGAFSVLCTAHHMPAGPTSAPTHLVSKHRPSEMTPKYAPHLCQVLLDDFFISFLLWMEEIIVEVRVMSQSFKFLILVKSHIYLGTTYEQEK